MYRIEDGHEGKVKGVSSGGGRFRLSKTITDVCGNESCVTHSETGGLTAKVLVANCGQRPSPNSNTTRQKRQSSHPPPSSLSNIPAWRTSQTILVPCYRISICQVVLPCAVGRVRTSEFSFSSTAYEYCQLEKNIHPIEMEFICSPV